MAKIARSARGEIVDFDILAIKQALASAPVSVATEERRQFIDTKNGIKPKKTSPNALKILEEVKQESYANVPDAMRIALEAANVSAQDIPNSKEEFERDESDYD